MVARAAVAFAALAALLVVAPAARAEAPRKPAAHRAGKKPRPAPPARPARKAKSARLVKLEKRLLELQSKAAIFPAVEVAKQVVALESRELGADDPETLQDQQMLAGLYAGTGDYVHANQIYKQQLARAETAHGKDSVEVAAAIEALASGYWVAQRYDDAEALYQRSLVIRKKQYGADNPMYAVYLQLYAGLMSSRSALSAAETAYLEAKKIFDKGKKDDPQQIGVLFGLGWVYMASGQERRAQATYERALAISEHAYQGDYAASARASMLLSVASIYQFSGKPELAKPLIERGRAIFESEIERIEKADPTDARLTSMLGQLAGMAQRDHKLDEAEALYRRAIAVSKAGKQGPMAAVAWLGSLAAVERERKHYKEALKLLGEMRAVYRKQLGAQTASFLDGQLADIHREMGDYGVAERMLKATIKQLGKGYGPRHPMVGNYRQMLASTYLADGKARPALDELSKSLAISEPALEVVLAAGTEQDHAAYFKRIAHELHLAVTLHARYAPKDKRAARLAMTTVLRRKGRILDAAANSVAVLRGKMSQGDRDLLDELTAARGQLAKLILSGPDDAGDPDAYAQLVADVETKVRRLEDQMRRKSAAYRSFSQPIELAAVQARVPDDTRLVEIVSYRSYDARAVAGSQLAGERRYAAYVLARRGDPVLVDLGPGDPIDVKARAFLEAVADPDRDDVGALGRALYDQLIAPLVPALGGKVKLLLAPDGALNLVPFGALTDDSGRFLVQRYTISYLTSGRDLLRIGKSARAGQGPMIIADPTFDDGSGGDSKRATSRGLAVNRGMRSRDLRTMSWQPLPGTAEEAAALDQVLAGATLLEGKRATEHALKAVKGPRILHIATHGFFLPAEAAASTTDGDDTTRAAPAAVQGASGPENPLLRAGLALAGANKLSSGDEDGVLTALEAAGLDLSGTKLVVLSACETGVGKVTDGDGVYGLRRALIIAGAESLVMSLWQVDDAATRDLMTGFYRRLGEGKGPAEALRDIQLRLQKTARFRHPYYWASFVPAGNWAPLGE